MNVSPYTETSKRVEVGSSIVYVSTSGATLHFLGCVLVICYYKAGKATVQSWERCGSNFPVTARWNAQ